MTIYLARHGEAKSSTEDLERPLSIKGEADVQNVASQLQGKNIQVKAIYHSGKTRAEQTAKILSGVVETVSGIEKLDGLEPLDDETMIINMILEEKQNFLFVGHLPFLSNLAVGLVGESTADLTQFSTGNFLAISYDEIKNSWSLDWRILP